MILGNMLQVLASEQAIPVSSISCATLKRILAYILWSLPDAAGMATLTLRKTTILVVVTCEAAANECSRTSQPFHAV